MSEKDRPDHDETQPVRPAGGATDPAPAAAPAAAAGPTDPAPEPAPATTALPSAPSAAGAGAGTGATPAAAGSGRRGFRERFRRLRTSDGDRGYGLAALVASALAGVIVGGVGVAVWHAATDDGRPDWGRHGFVGDRGGRDGFGRFGDRDDDGRGPMRGGPRGIPGQLPPTTPPQDDSDSSAS